MAGRHLVENPAKVSAANLADLARRETLAKHFRDGRVEESAGHAGPGGVGRLAGPGGQDVGVAADADVVAPLSCSNWRCRSPRLYTSSTRSRCPSRKCAPSIDLQCPRSGGFTESRSAGVSERGRPPRHFGHARCRVARIWVYWLLQTGSASSGRCAHWWPSPRDGRDAASRRKSNNFGRQVNHGIILDGNDVTLALHRGWSMCDFCRTRWSGASRSRGAPSATPGTHGGPWRRWLIARSCRLTAFVVDANGRWEPSALTTPTDIASYLWCVLAAEQLKIIGPDEARRRIERTLKSLERLDRAHGFFYDKIDPRTGIGAENLSR